MPEEIILELWQLIPTVVYFVAGMILFGIGILVMEKLTPFSIQEEIHEKQNVALGIIMGAGLIALAIVLSAALK